MSDDTISIIMLLLPAALVVILTGESVFKNTSRIIGLAFLGMGMATYIGCRFFGLHLPGGVRFSPKRLVGDDAIAAAVFLSVLGMILFAASPLETAFRKGKRPKELFPKH